MLPSCRAEARHPHLHACDEESPSSSIGVTGLMKKGLVAVSGHQQRAMPVVPPIFDAVDGKQGGGGGASCVVKCMESSRPPRSL